MKLIKILKRITSVILTLCLMAGIAGCGYKSSRDGYRGGSRSSNSSDGDIYVNGFNDLIDYKSTSEPSYSSAVTAPARVFNEVDYPYYWTLDDSGKTIYSEIFNTLEAGEKKVDFSIKTTQNELSDAFNLMLFDHPEIFWVDLTYKYVSDFSGNVTGARFEFYDFADTPEKLESAKREFESAAGIILAGANTRQNPIDKELYIHDAINSNTSCAGNAPYDQSAYSALVLGSSVCAGYSRAFQYLMQEAGIPCYYCTGTADGGAPVTGSYNNAHSWNIVRIGNSYCNVDCMWDDMASENFGDLIYPFFNVTDFGFKYHTRGRLSMSLPSCNDDSLKYSAVYGKTIEADEMVLDGQ